MTNIFFITGTDTEVGKTLSSCALLQSAIYHGYSSAGYKPVATGCKITSDGIRSYDALKLIKNSNIVVNYDQVNPLSFIKSTSPDIASHYEKKYIDFNILSKGLRILENMTDFLIVEGAGGWFTPIKKNFTYADWVIIEKLPVILIVSIKIGCINHALLTKFAIQKSGLSLVGWIANHQTRSSYYLENYLITLKRWMKDIPLLGEIPWIKKIESNMQLKDYINISLLKSFIK